MYSGKQSKMLVVSEEIDGRCLLVTSPAEMNIYSLCNIFVMILTRVSTIVTIRLSLRPIVALSDDYRSR